ncbi:hypothetical protein [Dokdonia sp. LLG6352-1]|uniref:hypothetical protein n=1 Tax=Dokdonia sp. LLG6352-1 TaxID=3160831 RepID=UPI00386894E4
MFMIPLGFVMFAIIIYILVSNKRAERKLISEARSKKPVRRVTVDSLANNQVQKQNSSSYVINEIFNTEQKLAVTACLEMISSVGSNNVNTAKRQSQKILIAKILSEDFNLNQERWNSYSNILTPSSVQATMQSLDSKGKRFFFSFVFDLLVKGGIPSQKEIMVAENICEKVAGISNYTFEKFMDETDNMLNSFN